MTRSQRMVAVTGALLLGAMGCSAGSTTKPAAVVTVTANPSPSQPSPSPTPTHTPSTLAGAYAATNSGVVRIDSIDCAGEGFTGTGFLIAPDLVATVAHVVAGANDIRITSPGTSQAVSGDVIGFSHQRDLALIRTESALAGHVFALDTAEPVIGQRIGTIGFSLGRSMQWNPGDITDTNDHRTVGGDNDVYDLSNQALTDATVNPGNSGGPWISKAGAVVALDESGPPYDFQNESRAEGNNGGVPASDAAPLMAKWRIRTNRIAVSSCTPDEYAQAAPGWYQTLSRYFYDIDNSDYASAYAQETASQGDTSQLAAFRDAVESSQDMNEDGNPDSPPFTVNHSRVGPTTAAADVTFVSTQQASKGPNHETCTVWTLRYHFSLVSGLWLIDASKKVPGIPENRSCDS